MPTRKIIVACPNGHHFSVKPQHLGRTVTCRHDDCQVRFELKAVADDGAQADDLEPDAPQQTALEQDTIEFDDLSGIIGEREPKRREPLDAANIAAQFAAYRPRPQRRWFVLAVLTLLTLFFYCVPVRTCPRCEGSGELPGRVVYRGLWLMREPAAVTPNRRCAVCSGRGQLTTAQVLRVTADDEAFDR